MNFQMDNGFEILYIFDFKRNDKCINLQSMAMYIFFINSFFVSIIPFLIFKYKH